MKCGMRVVRNWTFRTNENPRLSLLSLNIPKYAVHLSNTICFLYEEVQVTSDCSLEMKMPHEESMAIVFIVRVAPNDAGLKLYWI